MSGRAALRVILLLLVRVAPSGAQGAADAGLAGLSLLGPDGTPTYLVPGAARITVAYIVAAAGYCDACLEELKEVAALLGVQAPGVARGIVILSGHAEDQARALRRRVKMLCPAAQVLEDAAGLALGIAPAIAQHGYAPIKLLLDERLSILAVDSCSDTPREREAFQVQIRKWLNRLAGAVPSYPSR